MAKRSWLCIVGWEKLQPKHAGRAFPWIRFYDTDLDDLPLRKLSKTLRSDLYDARLLANRYGNHVPDDPELLRHILRSDDGIDWEALISAGFVRRSFAGKKAAKRRQESGLEVEVEVEERERKKKEVEGEGVGENRSQPSAALPARAPSFVLPNQEPPNSISIPLNSGTHWQLDNASIRSWEQKYPGIHVRDELEKISRKMEQGRLERPDMHRLLPSLEGLLKAAQQFVRN